MLRDCNRPDLYELVEIHKTEFNSHFLPSLGKQFLLLLYSNLLNNKDVSILIEDRDSHISGFVIGSKNFDQVFKDILTSNIFKYLKIIIPQIIKSPLLIKNIFESIFYPQKDNLKSPHAELVVIAVRKNFHRKGIGRKLILALEKKFNAQGIKRYKVSVNADNHTAINFYESMGFRKNRYFNLYGKKVNLYIKKLTN